MKNKSKIWNISGARAPLAYPIALPASWFLPPWGPRGQVIDGLIGAPLEYLDKIWFLPYSAKNVRK